MKKTLLVVTLAMGMLFSTTACDGTTSSKAAIKKYFPDQYSRAVKIATCESGLNPNAVSAGGGNWGLFQINRVHEPALKRMGYSWSKITDPNVNAKFARQLYDSSGWSAWSCSRRV